MSDSRKKWIDGIEKGKGNYIRGIKRAMKSNKQMHAKQGPIYEKYIMQMYAWISSEITRLNLWDRVKK